MQDFPILINITVALAVAFAGGLAARMLKLPTLVGYLLAGVAIGPFTPGFVGDAHTIQEMAELGVIFLLFGVGLHFSLRDLWKVRKIAIPGALLQMGIASGIGLLLTQLWGWSFGAGLLLGLGVSIASTVVLLRNLMDNGQLNTSAGQVAVGWLVLEDLATVLILVLLPALTGTAESAAPIWETAGIALLKAIAFAALMLVAGTRLIPLLLNRIAHLRSRELFIVSVVVITMGAAVGASVIFGVSLALGAFLAGVVVSESALSHQVEAEVLPFRETFAVLFFVSVGMLVNPMQLISSGWEVLAVTMLIILGKGLVTIILGLLLTRNVHTALIIAISLAQIGEFSFLLGQAGVAGGIMTSEQYSLLLAGSIISITLNPFLFKLIPRLEQLIEGISPLRPLLRGAKSIPTPDAVALYNHVVVVGYGRVGRHLVDVLEKLNVPGLVVENDIARAQELEQRNMPVLYGDAADSAILSHAHLDAARVVIVTLPDSVGSATVVATVRDAAPNVPLVVRAASSESIKQLYDLGATSVIYPELTGGLEIMHQALTHLGYTEQDLQEYEIAVRHDHYNMDVSSPEEREALARLTGVTA